MDRPLVVVFDLDGVIATGTAEEVYSDEAGWAYEKCEPLVKTIEVMRHLRESGCRLIVNTARWEKDRRKTEVWLQKYDVPYDELFMGKPSGDLYIDDRNYPRCFNPNDISSTEDDAEVIRTCAEVVRRYSK